MEQRKQYTTSNTVGWYVVSADRVTVVRVHPGMTIGETGSGELSFDRAHAQLVLDIDSDSSLVVRALGNIQLATEGSAQTDCLTFRRSVEVSLSQNTLMLNTEFVSFTPSKRPLRLSVVYPPVDMVITEAPAESIESAHRSAGVMPPSQPAAATAAPFAKSTQLESSANKSPTRLFSMRKALGAVVIASFSLVFAVLFLYPKTSTQPLVETDAVLQTTAPEVSEPSAPGPAQLSDERPMPRSAAVTTLTAPIEQLEPVETLKPIETLSKENELIKRESDAVLKTDDMFTSTDGMQSAATARPEESQQTPDDLAVITLPQETAAKEADVLDELPAAPVEPIETAQAVIEKSESEVRRDRARAEERALKRAQDRAIEQDLLVADVALAEGRLTSPEGSSALELYSRVLSQDPDSQAALRGLVSVREQLINRAFAQLAAGDWDRVPVTLDAAEQAGASGDLVADLRGEASYQLRLARARAGQFDELYSAQQLNAIEQTLPRLSRWRRGGYGPVEVEFTVTMRGDVRDVQVLGNPPPRLADTIGRAVETWRFEPVLENGRPLPVRTRMTIEVGS